MSTTWLVAAGLIAALAAIVAVLALRKARRRRALARTAHELGLRFSEGDPLGLSRDLGAEVSETIWGRFEGADVAIATASRAVHRSDSETWETGPIGVSLKIKVVRGLEVAQQAAGPATQVAMTHDGRLAVKPRIPRQRSAPTVLDPDKLPDLLQATARAARSQYW
ncbi:MAG TPA: hypothetical protein VH419_06440 [Nocardioidaceae bacterium]|jgi:hypothetical protein